jgi:16S rRNA (cytosine967-C5)-methyltransferase
MTSAPSEARRVPSGVEARRVAAAALTRIEQEGAFANLVLGPMLDESGLDTRDRGFVTELVYGTTRMRRACDWLVDRFVTRDPDPVARTWLRLGAYQLAFAGTPPHAAVSATVDAAPRRIRGFVNAILRLVSTADRDWPSEGVRLSYPDWILARLRADLGEADAVGALETMNRPPPVTVRDDGYTQDLASQWVADLVEAGEGMRVFDAAAAPGGKATVMAGFGALVVAADLQPQRARLVAANAAQLGLRNVHPVVADGRFSPAPLGSFDRVLLDAPCSGLGALRRRPDARWRIDVSDVDRLAALQRELVDALMPLVRPGGMFVYSVCTLTSAESIAVDDHLAERFPDLTTIDAPSEPWRPFGRGALLLPQDADTDGMFVLRLRVPDRD